MNYLDAFCEDEQHFGPIETYNNTINSITRCKACGDILSLIPLQKNDLTKDKKKIITKQ